MDGKKVDLTPKEYELLFYLVENKNIALSRDKLLSDIWGYDFFGDDRTIDTHIKNLRNSLGPYRDYIVTLRGDVYKRQVNHLVSWDIILASSLMLCLYSQWAGLCIISDQMSG